MSSLSEAIEEIKLALLNNKSDEVKEVYLRNAIRFIEEAQLPKLNENQEIVLGWLKDYYRENRPFTTTFGAIRSVASIRYGFIKKNLSEGQQNQVLQAFAEWGLEELGNE